MKTLTATLLFASLAAISSAQSSVTLVASFQGQDVGAATFTIEPQRDRTIVETTSFEITLPGQKIQIRSVERLDSEGKTLRSENKQTINGTVQKNVVVQFTANSAEVTDKATGVKKSYPAPAGANIRDISGLWFISVHPKVGQQSTATSFDVEKNSWHKVSRAYVADKPFMLEGKKLTAHQIKDISGETTVTALVDDKGLPLDLEVSGFHFVRKKA